MDQLVEHRRKQLPYLQVLYRVTKGNPGTSVNMWTLGEKLGFTRQETGAITHYLDQEQLVRITSMGGNLAITPLGVRVNKGELYHPILESSRSGQTGGSVEAPSLDERAIKSIAEAVRAEPGQTGPRAAAARVVRAKPGARGHWRRPALAVLLLAASLVLFLMLA